MPTKPSPEELPSWSLGGLSAQVIGLISRPGGYTSGSQEISRFVGMGIRALFGSVRHHRRNLPIPSRQFYFLCVTPQRVTRWFHGDPEDPGFLPTPVSLAGCLSICLCEAIPGIALGGRTKVEARVSNYETEMSSSQAVKDWCRPRLVCAPYASSRSRLHVSWVPQHDL